MKPRDLRAVAGAENSKELLGAAGLTPDQIRALPASVDLPTAAKCFGISETTARRLARAGEFPCELLMLGRQWRVPRAGIERALGIGEVSDVG